MKRYNVSTGNWNSLASTPSDNIREGGALTTDGNNIYLLRGDRKNDFYRYNVAANTWDDPGVAAGQRRLGRQPDLRRRLHLRPER